MCEASAQRRAGVPFFLAGFRRRYALLLGLALSIAAVCVLSRFILTIEVSGNEKVPTAAILTELSRQGVRVGAYGCLLYTPLKRTGLPFCYNTKSSSFSREKSGAAGRGGTRLSGSYLKARQ